ncbi:glycosyltransferase [Patulibacter sp. SYSU D01012]|uniref:glycosyltransferase n=1 Tax=Patulibacter sp. SYSU D01012 TaxID=2817381 RepID=UPI001B306F6B|nr:glycosyltransferase [Patulibacter sp. SYSU D01012]
MLQLDRPRTPLAPPAAPVRPARRPAGGAPGSPAGVEPPSVAPARPTVDVSVLIPVLDEEAHLPRCVPAMLAQDLDGTFELLFVDGGSRDRTVPLLLELQARDPRIRVLRNPRRTTAHGLNVALRAARGRHVARMDAHTEYPASYLRDGVERLARGDVDWVAGPQVPTGHGYWSSVVARALGGGLGRGASDKWRAADAAAPEEWPLTTSVFTGMWRRDTLDALGGWDGDWPVNQDSEMAARVLARGGRIVCRREMGAAYAPRDSLRRLARQYWRYGRFRARTFARHPRSCGPARLAAAALPAALAAAALPGPLGVAGRAAAAVYALAVVLQVVRLRPRPRDAAPLAAALVTMHLAWGAGFLASAVVALPRRRRLRAALPRPLLRPAA